MEKMLIPINYDTEQPTVSARDLHNGLEINTRFNDWFSRMTEYGFESGKDFYSKMSKTSETGGRPAIDYQISVDMAKQICMIQRSEKGKQYRQYFIDLEKAWNTPEQIFRPCLENGRSEDREAEREQRRSAGRCRAYEAEGNLCGRGERKHQLHPDRRPREAPASEWRRYRTEKIVRTAPQRRVPHEDWIQSEHAERSDM